MIFFFFIETMISISDLWVMSPRQWIQDSDSSAAQEVEERTQQRQKESLED